MEYSGAAVRPSGGGGASSGRKPAEQKQLRLLKIRNPWGRREWSGEWSARSDVWTEHLKAELGHTRADDGVFWMEYGDFLAAFDTVDVCKARRDWSHRAHWPTKRLFPALPQAWPANALDGFPQFNLKKTAEVAILLVQPTKRGKGDFRLSRSSQRLWYSDLSVAVVRNVDGGGREVVGLFSGAAPRVFSLELVLPAAQYTLLVFSLSAGGGQSRPHFRAHSRWRLLCFRRAPPLPAASFWTVSGAVSESAIRMPRTQLQWRLLAARL